MLYARHTSGVVCPASACLTIPMDCVSLNPDFLIWIAPQLRSLYWNSPLFTGLVGGDGDFATVPNVLKSGDIW